jgi:hypothetical protein
MQKYKFEKKVWVEILILLISLAFFISPVFSISVIQDTSWNHTIVFKEPDEITKSRIENLKGRIIVLNYGEVSSKTIRLFEDYSVAITDLGYFFKLVDDRLENFGQIKRGVDYRSNNLTKDDYRPLLYPASHHPSLVFTNTGNIIKIDKNVNIVRNSSISNIVGSSHYIEDQIIFYENHFLIPLKFKDKNRGALVKLQDSDLKVVDLPIKNSIVLNLKRGKNYWYVGLKDPNDDNYSEVPYFYNGKYFSLITKDRLSKIISEDVYTNTRVITGFFDGTPVVVITKNNEVTKAFELENKPSLVRWTGEDFIIIGELRSA